MELCFQNNRTLVNITGIAKPLRILYSKLNVPYYFVMARHKSICIKRRVVITNAMRLLRRASQRRYIMVMAERDGTFNFVMVKHEAICIQNSMFLIISSWAKHEAISINLLIYRIKVTSPFII